MASKIKMALGPTKSALKAKLNTKYSEMSRKECIAFFDEIKHGLKHPTDPQD